MEQKPPEFSMRLFAINYYLSKPEPGLDQTYSDFRIFEVKQVPILRIFGTTSQGQKTCLHVHNVYPYLLIKPFKVQSIDNMQDLNKYLFELANQIDRILNVSMCVKDPCASQHVFKIEPIKTKSMYGYYENDSIFLKVYLFHPEVIKKLSELFLCGNIMGESMQTFESHVPFNLQFLMDFNLFGMNHIHLEKVMFRRHLKQFDENGNPIVAPDSQSNLDPNKWNVNAMNDDQLLDEKIERQSLCELELDCTAESILNPCLNKNGKMLNPGLSALWEEEKNRRSALNITLPLENIDNEERTNILVVENELEFKKRLISLLETRFEAKYPFNKKENKPKSSKDNQNQTFQDFDADINDDSILEMLNDLHNNSDLENSMLYATQMNEDDAEILVDENKDMTQIELKSKIEKGNESIEKENEQYLTHLSQEDDDDDDDDTISSDNQSDAENNTTKSAFSSRKNNRLDLLDESVVNSSTSSDDSFTSNAKNIQTTALRDTSHFCTYFQQSNLEQDDTPKCKHPVVLGQKLCLKCEFGKELKDSLDHMAFLSPDKQTNNFRNNLDFEKIELHGSKIESPSIIESLKEEIENDYDCADVINDTICENESSSGSPMKMSQVVVKKVETPKKSLDERRTTKKRRFKEIKEDVTDSVEWYCPRIEPPLANDCLEKCFKKSNETLVSYFKIKDKYKMKLNLNKFESTLKKSKFTDFECITLDESTENDLIWFTPVITLPSIKRVQKRIKSIESSQQHFCKKRKLRRLSRLISTQIGSESQSQVDRTLSTLNETISDANLTLVPDSSSKSPSQKNFQTPNQSQQKMTTILNQMSSIKKITESRIGKSSIRIESNINNKRRKTVRFDEKTVFINEENKMDEVNLKPEKGHLSVVIDVETESSSTPGFELQRKRLKSSFSNTSSSLNDTNCELSFPSFDSNSNSTSNDTVLVDDEASFDTTLDQTKPSFFEYDSILFPKSKLIDCMSLNTNLNIMATTETSAEDTILVGANEPKKESKKDKKLVKAIGSSSEDEITRLTLMSLEVHANTRANMTPNPESDQIGFVCYTINEFSSSEINESKYESHLIVVMSGGPNKNSKIVNKQRYLGINSTPSGALNRLQSINYVNKEEELLELVVKAVHKYNPDILVGFELQKLSWGFLMRRAIRLKIQDYCCQLSRLPKHKRESFMRILQPRSHRTPFDVPNPKGPASGPEISPIPLELVVAGRVVLNIWRVLRSELALNVYTLENCVFHILNERVPKYSFTTLTSWFTHVTDLYRWKTFDYYVYRSEANLRLLDVLNLIGKTCEFAKVYGIEFYHVLSRGSQYRVESMMLRIARKLNYVAFSANQKQKQQMRAPECIPLTLEPESKFYQDPVAVLDFQSLYPSVIIAYNLCFTTCLGRVKSFGKEVCFKFGCGSLYVPDELLQRLDFDKDVYVAPNGVAFVKKHIRVGILPTMLENILDTRVMVKNSMKIHKQDENLVKIFDSRQLSLKLIANVTFGYTAANYSGRMPCVEVGDTIVRVARQTLENSIHYIQKHSRAFSNARVVYGDTDSVFVLFESSSKTLAFNQSYKLVNEITNLNVKPVKLKFEKIYLPSILLAKKRYLGYMYETEDQLEATLDVKGIEIIRRDGCQVAAKILERACRVLFEFRDADKVKEFFIKHIVKLVNGKINLKDFIIAKEYRGRDTYSNMRSIAACQIANKALASDPLAEPLTGERVPYVIVCGMPGLPLYELVRSPYDLIDNTSDLKLNYEYYVMKQVIPPLQRIMSLLNCNVYDWVKTLSFKPKIFHYGNIEVSTSSTTTNAASSRLANYIYSADCVLCGKKCENTKHTKSKRQKQQGRGLCESCESLDQQSIAKLLTKLMRVEKNYTNLMRICQLCTQNDKMSLSMGKNECCSLDCPNNFHCSESKQELKKANYIRKVIDQFF